MAKAKFGAALADARGSVAGLVFTKNRFGQILRQKVSPVQPRSIRQAAARAALQYLATRWANSLSDAQRAAWIALANANPVTNAFGDSITLTGMQYYVRVNRNLGKVGEAYDDDAPANQDVTGLLTVTLSAAEVAATMSVAWTATPLAAAHRGAFWASPPMSSGRSFNENLLKFLTFTLAADPSPFDIAPYYLPRFGVWQAGQHIFVRAGAVNTTNGAESAYLTDDVIVAA